MNKMVERVARALYEKEREVAAKYGFSTMLHLSWLRQDAQTQQDWRIMARAAIEAMREPSEKMYITGACDAGTWNRVGKEGEADPGTVWIAMINEALK